MNKRKYRNIIKLRGGNTELIEAFASSRHKETKRNNQK